MKLFNRKNKVKNNLLSSSQEIPELVRVEKDTCITAKKKQELYFELEKGIALVFYASDPARSRLPGHRIIIHIQRKEFIFTLLSRASEDLRGEEFKVTLYKPTQENSNDEMSELVRDTQAVFSEIFSQRKKKDLDIKAEDCGKLCLYGQVEIYQLDKQDACLSFCGKKNTF